MRRLTALLAVLLSAVALAACGAERRDPPADPGPSPSGAPGGGPEGRDAAPGGVATAEPPARAAPPEPYAVGSRGLRLTRADRALRVTLWYPAAGPPGGRVRADADPARGRFPVILFSHGLGGAPADYRQLVTRWAAAGFVVAAPAYPFTNRDAPRVDVLDVLNQPADASHVLSRVLALNSAAGDPLRGRLETGRVAAAGHSAGAITTIGLFTLARDARLDAGIVLAGTSLGVGTAFSGAAAPLMFVHGARDNVVSYAAGKAAYDSVPWPKALLTLPEGDHGRALSDGDDPSFRVVADTTVEFLRWSLYGDPAAKRRLPTDAARGNRATLDNRL